MPNAKPVNLYMLLDESGSMGGQDGLVRKAVNAYIKGLQDESEAGTSLTIVRFGVYSMATQTWYHHIVQDIALEEFEPITIQDYFPRGGTPLYESITMTIQEAGEQQKNQVHPGDVLIVILTDGMDDNAPAPEIEAALSKLIAKKRAEGYGFVMLEFGGAARGIGQMLGIPNVMQFGPMSTEAAFERLKEASVEYSNSTGRSEKDIIKKGKKGAE